jgi:hypothetical protein
MFLTSFIVQEAPDGAFEIQLQDISRVYGKRTVVDAVNLSVKQGEVVRVPFSSSALTLRNWAHHEHVSFFFLASLRWGE